jgi:hypothetical protein
MDWGLGRMTRELRTRIVSIHGQKPNPWAGTLGWFAGNTQMRSDDMLAGSFLQVEGGDGKMGFPSLCGVWGMSRASSLIMTW